MILKCLLLYCIHDISKLPLQVVLKFLELVKVAYEGICKNAFVFTDFDEDFDHLGQMNTSHTSEYTGS